jgi:TRAP-type C4-dicarboxylate transport system permease small subunit
MKSGSHLRPSRILFLTVMLIIALLLVWPGYALFSDTNPLILGFPLSFAWVIFCTLIGFVAMLALYLYDYRDKES